MPSRKKRKIYRKRLLSLVLVLAVCVGLVGTGIYYLFAHFNSSKVVLASSSQLEVLDEELSQAFVYQHLNELENSIQELFVSTKAEEETVSSDSYYLSGLREQIENYLRENNINEADISWAIQDLRTDNTLESANSREDFVAASTYKLPLMMLWVERIASGQNTMEDTFQLTSDMLEKEDEENPDQPIGKKYDIDEWVPLYELIQAAAIYSDNLAGHMLFANIGGYSEYKTQALKYSQTPQSMAFTDASKNVLNSHYTMELVHYLYTTEDTFDDLKYWLMLGGYDLFLNKNEQKDYIQKLGNIDEVRNVIGYYPGEFPFSISIYSRIDKDQGEQIIADIGDIAYNYFEQLFYSGYYDTVEGRQPIYTYWQLYGGAPGNVFWEFDMESENKANSKENIEKYFG